MSVQGFRYLIFNSKDISPSNEPGYGPYTSVEEAIATILTIFRVPAQGEVVPDRSVTGYLPPLGLHFGVVSNGIFTEYEYRSGTFNLANFGIGIVPSSGGQGSSISISDHVPTGNNGDVGNSNVALSTVGAYALALSIGSSVSGVSDVIVNGSSVVSNGIANITISGSTDLSQVEARLTRIELILGDLMGSTSANDSTFEVIESNYSLRVHYHNDMGIDASPRAIQMTSLEIYENGQVVSSDASDLTNVLIFAKIGLYTIFSSTNLRESIPIPGNASNTPRDILIYVYGTYEGHQLNYIFTLPQGADNVIGLLNVTYNGSTVTGTEIDPSDFYATGSYASGKSPAIIYGQETNPTEILEGTNQYTVIFEDGITATISISSL